MNNDRSLIIDIENSIDYIRAEAGENTVLCILTKYGARNVDELNPVDYADVFGELYQIEIDLRSDEAFNDI